MHRAPMAFAPSGGRPRRARERVRGATRGLLLALALGLGAAAGAGAVPVPDGCAPLARPDAAVDAASWRTGWLEAACAFAAVALLWAGVALSMRAQAARTRSRFEDRLRERERIARELHDTLLQGTQGLVLNFQVVAGELPPGDARRQRLERLLDDADGVIAQARDRIFNLRDRESEPDDLAASLSAIGADLAAGSAIRFEAHVEGDLSRLRPAVAGEALLLGRAALSNAFRHSRGDRVTLAIVATQAGLCIRVHDNGDGITDQALSAGPRPGHWGLAGMKERAVRVGGRLLIHGEPGLGTDVRLELPAHRAFAPGGPARFRFRWAILRRWLGDRLMRRLKKEVSE